LSGAGLVYLVGAGPGDPGLITLRGVECISRGDVIVFDYLANRRLLDHAATGAELVYAGKIGGRHNQNQEEINCLLIEKAREGKTVVRLKGGDPFVFGRGGEECEALRKAGVPFEVVPGVTAAIGASAYAGIPLTHRDFTASVQFVTGQEGDGKDKSNIDWERISVGNGTVVFYMGVFNLRHNMQKMIEHGRAPETPVALVRWGTLPEQEVLEGRIADIADMAEKSGFKPPAITIVGDVVKLRSRLRWYDNRPLSGRKIMVTRSSDQSGVFSSMLAEEGAEVIECPTIKIFPPSDDFCELDSAIADIGSFDWLILTSINSVKFLFERMELSGKDARSLGRCRIMAVGPQTGAGLRSHGIRADMIPADYKAEGVIAEFEKIDMKGKKVLFPRSEIAREVIPRGVERMGAICVSPVAYRNEAPESIPEKAMMALEKHDVDCVVFTSSSTVANLAGIVGKNILAGLLRESAVASIGPITSKTCRECTLEVDIEPEEYTLSALKEKIVEYFSAKGNNSAKRR